jgi:enamine deaminase RidA (YjgF/YER057c/UK114 family)
MNIDEALQTLGLTLPQAPRPIGAYLPCVQSGNLLFLSGVLPFRNGKLARTGKVGSGISLEDAAEDAAQTALNALAIARAHLDGFERLARCVKLTGFVACAPDFYDHPKVLNGASELLFKLMGEAGRHARAAVGVSALPMNSPVEVDFIFEVRH